MFRLALLAGISGVLLLDTLGSLATRGSTTRYAALAPLSYALWILSGILGGLGHRPDLLLAVSIGAVAGAIVGFVDGSVGWWISTALGATPMSSGQTWALRIRTISPRVAMRAALFGAVGGFISAIA